MRYVFSALLVILVHSHTTASDWLTMPSTYSHDAVNGQRVSQYAAIEMPTTLAVPNFRTSGYTHSRSRLNFRGSMDNYHRVETWGDPVRPYGEWQRPFRPGSVPYALWGPPFGGLNLGLGGTFPVLPGAGTNPGFGNRPGHGPGYGWGHGHRPGNGHQPGHGHRPGPGYGPGNGGGQPGNQN